MILIDEKGTRIQATVSKPQIPKYDALLQEGGIRYISNFGVADNSEKELKFVNSKFKLNFYHNTKVNICEHFEGPMHGFAFADFANIFTDKIHSKVTFDVIGHVVSCGKLEPSEEGKDRIDFEIVDLNGVKIKVSLWGKYACQMSDYVTSPSLNGCIIIIITFAKTKVWRDSQNISNTYYATQLFINTDIEEIQQFKNNLMLTYGDDMPRHEISQLSSKPYTTIRNDFLEKTPKKMVDELRAVNEVMSCIVVGTIKYVETNQPWWYTGCKKCTKKAEKETKIVNAEEGSGQVKEKQIFKCKSCKLDDVAVAPMFRLQVRVQDSTGSVSLTLFDRHATKLLNITANELLDKMQELGDVDMYPDMLNRLIDKRFAFKVEVSKWNLDNKCYVFTILRLTEDEKILTDLQNLHPPEQPDMSDTITSTAAIGASSPGDPLVKDAISCTGDNNTPETVEKSTASSPNMKIKVDKSFDASPDLKRKLEDVYVDDVSVQNSGNKNKIPLSVPDNVSSDKCEQICLASKEKLLIPKIEK